MPIYEYQCDSCHHTFDALQKLSDEPLKVCPECGAESLRKLVSAPSFRLKGTGWYETDFKKSNQKNLADGGQKGGDKSADQSGKKSGDKAASSSKKDSAAAKPAASKKASSGSASAD
ncbi:MAG: zinc ribbon domain-containing protein [Pseudomonadota bacterium]